MELRKECGISFKIVGLSATELQLFNQRAEHGAGNSLASKRGGLGSLQSRCGAGPKGLGWI